MGKLRIARQKKQRLFILYVLCLWKCLLFWFLFQHFFCLLTFTYSKCFFQSPYIQYFLLPPYKWCIFFLFVRISLFFSFWSSPIDFDILFSFSYSPSFNSSMSYYTTSLIYLSTIFFSPPPNWLSSVFFSVLILLCVFRIFFFFFFFQGLFPEFSFSLLNIGLFLLIPLLHRRCRDDFLLAS